MQKAAILWSVPVAVEDVVIHAALALPDDGVSLVQTVVDDDAIVIAICGASSAYGSHAERKTTRFSMPLGG